MSSSMFLALSGALSAVEGVIRSSEGGSLGSDGVETGTFDGACWIRRAVSDKLVGRPRALRRLRFHRVFFAVYRVCV
ncbi:hypothetical protein BDZ89DRAFT_588258 [Hymenopellis radicata]|nr:hypothetical protein BDZ89DRAFT_588258 [Hymenopellis radicata]